MTRFRVTRDLDYVMGHLRYGHLEGEFEAESKEDLMEKLKSGSLDDALEVVADDYEVEDCGDAVGYYEIEEIFGGKVIMEDWVPCSKEMPEEHESVFNVFYGADEWRQGMYRTCSQYMFVTAENDNGDRYVTIAKTRDGKWKLDYCVNKYDKVIAWLKTPRAYMGTA